MSDDAFFLIQSTSPTLTVSLFVAQIVDVVDRGLCLAHHFSTQNDGIIIFGRRLNVLSTRLGRF